MVKSPGILQPHTQERFLSLRWRLLAGFTLVFTTVFAGAYYWFYNFSTEKTMNRLIQDLQSTAVGAAEGVDVPELLALYEEGERNEEGFSDDPRYANQMEWFATVHSIEPRVYPYTYIVAPYEENRRVGEAAVGPGEMEIIYLVDSLSVYNPDKALYFLESDASGPLSLAVLETGEIQYRDMYTDEWGSWISAYTPVEDEDGNVVAVLGADIEASYVLEVQKAIRDRIWLAFGVTYGTLLFLVFLLSDVLTRRLNHLTDCAERIGEGDYDQNLSSLSHSQWQDEISKLSKVFELMVSKVRQREETLKQQVAELKIEIDQSKRKRQVKEIVESDFFQDLMGKAHTMRNRIANRDSQQVQDPPPA